MALATIRPRRFSSHYPIIIVNGCFDFGPSPFRFFNSWLMVDGLDDIVKKVWVQSSLSGTTNCRLAKKCIVVTNELKRWRAMES